VNPIVDTIVVILFVMLIVYIFRGYHLSKMREREEEENNQKIKDTTKKSDL
jgi:heme/copper-type cytochrome/quinol oxidase subunit 2